MRIIALEEHVVTEQVLDAWHRLDPQWQDLALQPSSRGETARRLLDLGEDRRKAMAVAGVDVQILSLTAPGVQNLAADEAIALQRSVNDVISDTVRSAPERFQGFATLATPAPEAAAKELDRAVTRLGLNGAMLFGRTRDRNLDHPANWPIFETADALRAPLYIHPQSPRPEVRDALYGGLGDELDAAIATHGLGWHYETGVQILRLILSGVFDRFPNLQLITGHWGEVVLFYLERIDSLTATAKLARPVSEYFRANVSVTPSGIFSQRYLRWAIEVLGADRILLSTDYPFENAPPGGALAFLEEADLSAADRALVAHGNWDRLIARIQR